MAAIVTVILIGRTACRFGPVYSLLVRENQWSELCTDEERLEAGGGVLCAAQEVRLQYVFSTGFLCLSAANAFFGVLLDVVGPESLSCWGSLSRRWGISR